MARSYVRNGVWNWSIDRQLGVLREAGELDEGQLYQDAMPAAQAKHPAQVKPEWLTERARLLQPTARRGGETIRVATMIALAVSEADLVSVLALAAARKATLAAVDSGVSIAPDSGIAGAQVAIADWTRAKRDAQTAPGRRLGNATAAALSKQRTLDKLPIARPLWGRPTAEISSEEIAKRAGLSIKTLYSYLGRREVAQYAATRRKRKGKTK